MRSRFLSPNALKIFTSLSISQTSFCHFAKYRNEKGKSQENFY